MGRLIEADELLTHIEDYGEGQYRLDLIAPYYVRNAPTIEAIPKDQYEARLKADMLAMLTELQLEIEELDSRAGYSRNGMPTFSTDYIRKKKVNELVQQKINKLKENKDGME